MNDNLNENINVNPDNDPVNEIDTSTSTDPATNPPISDGDPVNDIDTSTSTVPATNPPISDGGSINEINTSTTTTPASTESVTTSSSTSTTTTTTTTQNIFGFVQSLFTNVVQNWGGFNWFNSKTFMPTFGWGQQSPMGAQSRGQGGFFGFVNNFVSQGISSIFGSSMQQTTTTTTTTNEVKTVTLDEKGNKEVWLSNESDDVAINATNTTGSNILAGNDKDNQIFGGSGTNDMWGGSSKTNDYLFGGSGQNTFWYGKGEGVDLVENTKKGDTINLYNITLGDISNVEITNSSISIVIGDSEGIAVSGSDEVSPTFKLANGESYNYNRSSAEWQQA